MECIQTSARREAREMVREAKRRRPKSNPIRFKK
jgi:hypothetical protein